MLAKIEEGKNNINEAITEYRKLIEIQPDSIQGLMGLAVLLEQAGQLMEAKKVYRHLLQFDGQFAPAANNLSWLLTREEKPDLGEALRLAQIEKES